MQLFILLTNKGDEILFFCKNRDNLYTEIFKQITNLGEWIGLVTLAVYLAVTNRRALLATILSFIPMDILMVSMKKILDFPRPLLYFSQGEITPIENFQPLYNHSMPSGHTFTAFFTMSFVCFFFQLGKTWQFFFFTSAVLVGVSRMYLMCHFKEDVFVGSILGIIAGIIPVFIYNKWLEKR